jgi:putative DNA primase/helicase
MTNVPSDVLAAGLAWQAAGFSVVPVTDDGQKRPNLTSWDHWKTNVASDTRVRAWLGPGGSKGLGLVMGTVSGAEMLELEGRAIAEGLGPQFRAACRDNDAEHLLNRLMAGYVEYTPSGGMHFIFRVDGEPLPNRKLARRPATDIELGEKPGEKYKVLIETRGEGGFVVVAPTPGECHPSGRPWTVHNGGPDTLATLTTEERDHLYAIATMFDTVPVVEFDNERPNRSTGDESEGKRPGDLFIERSTWNEILEPHGWTLMHRIGSGYGWRRPGKTDRSIAATTGTSSDGADRLYVFSSSTEFEVERPYNKFHAYAVLNHGGDFTAAGKALYAEGYRDETRPPRSTVLSLIAPERPTPVQHVSTPSTTTGAPTTNGTSALAINAAPAPEATLTDVGNAQLLVAAHGQELRYVARRGAWLRWSGHRWRWDHSGWIVELAKQTILSIQAGSNKDVHKHKLASLSRRSIEAMIALARSDAAVSVDLTDLDAHPYALCTPDGVVDLRNGRLRPGEPGDLHTRSTRARCDPEWPIPKWSAFLDQTFAGDQELIGFVQRLAGYSATGAVTHHILPFLHGPGGNGKSVFLDVLRSILGDYAGAAPAKFLMAAQQQHETEIARLAGLRMVICSEVNQEDRFDEAKVKLLTGGDALTARFLNQDHFDFTPTHHLWLMGNHQPRVSSGGDSFWRRLRMVPFTNRVPDESKIEGLAELLIDQEAPGILAWVVNGAIDAIKAGMREPSVVLAATETYASEEDSVARFIADKCHLGGGRLVRLETSLLRKKYEDWCRDEGEKPCSAQALGRELRSRWSIEQARSNGRRYYLGITLLADEDDPSDPHWSDR